MPPIPPPPLVASPLNVHYSIGFVPQFFAVLKNLCLEKRGYTAKNIANEPLKVIKTGIFLISRRCVISRYVCTIFGDLWFVIGDVIQKSGPLMIIFSRPIFLGATMPLSFIHVFISLCAG